MKKIPLVPVLFLRERQRLPLILRKWEQCLLLVVCLTLLLVTFVPREEVRTVRLRYVSVFTLNEGQNGQRNIIIRESSNIGVGSQDDAGYLLVHPEKQDFSGGLSKIIDELLNLKENGFFVELGAGDGENGSVSLFFERERHWQGVLVEKNEDKCNQIMSKNRRATLWSLNIRSESTNMSSFDADIEPKELFNLLHRSTFDLLVINLQDLALEIIKSINFTEHTIQVVSLGLRKNVLAKEYTELTDYLHSKGYNLVHTKNGGDGILKFIFSL